MLSENDIKRADKFASPSILGIDVDLLMSMTPGQRHEMHMQFGARQGWWMEWNDKSPIKITTFKISEFHEKSKMAHVLSHSKVKIFKSVTEALKTGHKGPVKTGTFLFNKGMLKVIIE